MNRAAIVPILALCLASCAPDEEVGRSSAELIRGWPTSARPEVGQFYRAPRGSQGGEACTATLIARRYALTAAHCLDPSDYQDTAVRPGDRVVFSFGSYAIERIHSFSSGMKDRVDSGYSADTALLRLAAAVPSTVARPAAIAGVLPDESSVSTIIGFGCSDRYTQGGLGYKRYFTFTGTRGNSTCAGDSGGPVVFGELGDLGPIWGDVVGWSWDVSQPGQVSIFDVFADATYARKQIEGLMRAWDGDVADGMDRSGGAYDVSSLPPSAAAASSCRSRCLADGPRCRAWSWVMPGVWSANGRCVLRKGVGDLRPAPGVVSGLNPDRPGFEAEPGLDRPGHDYRSFALTSGAAECATACAQDWTCRAYAVDSSVSPEVCSLKNGVADAIAASRISSGVKRGLEMQTDREGSDYRSFPIDGPTPERCQATCALEAACLAWSYVAPKAGAQAECRLKSAVPPPSAAPDRISGVKGSEYY